CFSSRRRHTRSTRDWSSDVCSSDLVAETVFFFHPIVWLAHREFGLAQEIACDELAVLCTGSRLSAYGAVLLQVAAQRREAGYSRSEERRVGQGGGSLRATRAWRET